MAVPVVFVDPGMHDSLSETGPWDPGTVTTDGFVPGGNVMPSTSLIALSRLTTIEHWLADATGTEPSAFSPNIAATMTAAGFARATDCRRAFCARCRCGAVVGSESTEDRIFMWSDHRLM